jgi:hypothetical protein
MDDVAELSSFENRSGALGQYQPAKRSSPSSAAPTKQKYRVKSTGLPLREDMAQAPLDALVPLRTDLFTRCPCARPAAQERRLVTGVPETRRLRPQTTGAHHGSNSSQASGPANDPISRHGINDPVSGVDVKLRNHDNATPHEREQRAADVRAEPAADKTEPFLPEALRRKPAEPLNKRTGRNPSE